MFSMLGFLAGHLGLFGGIGGIAASAASHLFGGTAKIVVLGVGCALAGIVIAGLEISNADQAGKITALADANDKWSQSYDTVKKANDANVTALANIQADDRKALDQVTAACDARLARATAAVKLKEKIHADACTGPVPDPIRDAIDGGMQPAP